MNKNDGEKEVEETIAKTQDLLDLLDKASLALEISNAELRGVLKALTPKKDYRDNTQ